MNKKSIILVVTVLACWSLMLVGDWFMRFYWYKWHRSFIRHQSSLVSNSPEKVLQDRWSDGSWGGDLTQLIGIPSLQKKFEQKHPAIHNITDEYGFRNRPPTDGRYHPVVVVGDSFMNISYAFTNSFAGRLAYYLKTNVYNRSVSGRGAIYAVNHFFDDQRFASNPPKFLVWGLLEREIHGNMIAGSLIWDLWIKEHPEDNRILATRVTADGPINYKVFRAKALKKSLPNSSALAQMGKRIWNRIRYRLFRKITPEVVIAKGKIEGEKILFYRESIDFMKMGDDTRLVGQVVWGLSYLSEFCMRKGIKLVVVLIPDKAEVYRESIPDTLNPREHSIPASCLWAVESGLQSNSVLSVNLLLAFREQAANNTLLYWPDDTHWNVKAINIAAEFTAEVIENAENSRSN